MTLMPPQDVRREIRATLKLDNDFVRYEREGMEWSSDWGGPALHREDAKNAKKSKTMQGPGVLASRSSRLRGALFCAGAPLPRCDLVT
ncbi:MAG: hypothetical protein FJ271_01180 [Planctomycetes bacterium]|nr:hypothetical protein [Planctomycetota bacterium]